MMLILHQKEKTAKKRKVKMAKKRNERWPRKEVKDGQEMKRNEKKRKLAKK